MAYAQRLGQWFTFVLSSETRTRPREIFPATVGLDFFTVDVASPPTGSAALRMTAGVQ